VKSKLIIAAITARGYAEAAQASGYKVATLDAFADSDTRGMATECLSVKVGEEGVDEEDFKYKFTQINLEDGGCRFIYGSLFDAKPELLSWVSERVAIVGNSPETLKVSRSLEFFSLLDELNIPYPELCLSAPDNTEGWLVKKLTGTGGVHIRLASLDIKGDYFQREINGEPVSLLFLADGKVARTVGFNQQLLAPTAETPYRFAGAVSNILLPLQVQQQFIHAAQALTTALGLRGLNSLDALLEGDKLWFLELNPRLSATFQLYPNLLPAHLEASAGKFVALAKTSTSKAQLTLYADKQLNIPMQFVWPDWVADIPYVASIEAEIAENEPVCTVLAEAENAIAAHQLALERVKKLKGKLFHD
jgi:predicted ATP-grasp superfamily ATP-dependent carboligase